MYSVRLAEPSHHTTDDDIDMLGADELLQLMRCELGEVSFQDMRDIREVGFEHLNRLRIEVECGKTFELGVFHA